MNGYAMLIDETMCTGCRACQVACKQWNDLPGEVTHNSGTYQNPPRLSAQTWNLIEFHEAQSAGRPGFYFLKRSCMHCNHPACASVCPVGALRKLDDGPVVYDAVKCIGCRYCMAACPFGVPAFEWNKGLIAQPVIRKCNFCVDRLNAGLVPLCAKTCPTRAILFGRRDDLLVEGEARIRQSPGRYVDHLYGKEEVGGTSILYLSSIPFAALGLPLLDATPATARSEQVMEYTVPFAVTWAAALAGLAGIAYLRKRGERRATAPVDEKADRQEAPV